MVQGVGREVCLLASLGLMLGSLVGGAKEIINL
jgi:hypothetical protein